MRGLDVLGEDEHADLRVLVLDLLGGARALVGEGGRHADVDHDELGPVTRDRGEQARRVAERGDDLVAAVLEQPRQALAQEHLVLGDHDRARQLRDERRAAARRRSRRAACRRGPRPGPTGPRSPEPRRCDGAADAVVGDRDDEACRSSARALSGSARRCACLTALVSPSQR